jgi:hypothetical protein
VNLEAKLRKAEEQLKIRAIDSELKNDARD